MTTLERFFLWCLWSLKSGKTPITVHSRVRSLFRFTEYSKNHGNSVLPSPDFEGLQSMLNGVEKSLVRERNKLMKSVMSVNRINFEHTCPGHAEVER